MEKYIYYIQNQVKPHYTELGIGVLARACDIVHSIKTNINVAIFLCWMVSTTILFTTVSTAQLYQNQGQSQGKPNLFALALVSGGIMLPFAATGYWLARRHAVKKLHALLTEHPNFYQELKVVIEKYPDRTVNFRDDAGKVVKLNLLFFFIKKQKSKKAKTNARE